eukprot:s8957_g1.t1
MMMPIIVITNTLKVLPDQDRCGLSPQGLWFGPTKESLRQQREACEKSKFSLTLTLVDISSAEE